MKFGWIDPKRKAAKMAVGIYYFPGGFDGAQLVRPAVIEMGDGQLVEIPMFLTDSDDDLVEAVAELDALYTQNQRSQRAMPPQKVRKKRGPKPKRK